MSRAREVIASATAVFTLAACDGGAENYPSPIGSPVPSPVRVEQLAVLACPVPNAYTLDVNEHGDPELVSCGVAESLRDRIAHGQEVRVAQMYLPLREVGACAINPLIFGDGEHFMAVARTQPGTAGTPEVTAFGVAGEIDVASVPQSNVVLRPATGGVFEAEMDGWVWPVAAAASMSYCE